MTKQTSSDNALVEKIACKCYETFPPSEMMGNVMIHCFCKHISLLIAHQVPVNKNSWEYRLNPDIKRIVEIITEQESDAVNENDEPNDLLKMDWLVRRYVRMCEGTDTHYVYAYAYKDRVFYDVSGVGDLDHPDKKKMWKLEVLTPGRVKKEIRAKKEPAQEYLLDVSKNRVKCGDI